MIWLSLFIGVALLIGLALASPDAAFTMLKPGDDIQAAVDAAPAGAVFVLEPGIYRQQSIVPKNGQRFVGMNEAILNGAILISKWHRESDYWFADDAPKPLHRSGYCLSDDGLCTYREDLFVDGSLRWRAASLAELSPGKWYIDENRVYLDEDPNRKMIELSVTPRAFSGAAKQVSIENLIVEKYASEAQMGAIDGSEGEGWEVVDVVARWNHGTGLEIGKNMHVVGGSFSHNGQLGMRGIGDGALIENVEISYNNYAAYSWGWEAGGTKFSHSAGLAVRNSCIHHNLGPGLWTDIDNIDIIMEGNRIFANSGSGIKHEISYGAIIRNNTVRRNGSGKDNWLWGSQILIQNSQNTEVYENTVEIDTSYGNGIGLIYQDRGTGAHGPRITANNRVHHNRIIHLGTWGQNGAVADYDQERFWREGNNLFDANTYVVPKRDFGFWNFGNRRKGWSRFRDEGMEPNGTLIIDSPTPIDATCGNG